VGLGGGEFRLPVLMYAVGYPAKTAVTLNLMVSIVTLTFALVVRNGTISVGALVPYLNGIFGLAAGGVVSAFYAIETGRGPKRIVSAMTAGSLIGAALGGLAVGFAPVDFIKVVLGVVLIVAAAKVAISQH
jgi:uncharacterized membrane protein YfcA